MVRHYELIFLVIILSALFVGCTQESTISLEDNHTYNGYSFTKDDGLWWTERFIGERYVIIPLHYSPEEVKNVEVVGKLSSELLNSKKVFVSIDPSVENKYYTLGFEEFSVNLAQGLQKEISATCTTEHEACEGREILFCNEEQNLPVIEMAYGGEPKVEYYNSCVRISGEEKDFVRATNRVLLKLYGIMN